MISTPYTQINAILSRSPPEKLFHYTSPAGAIGIVSSKSFWATHIKFLNDIKELGHAVDYARNVIENLLRKTAYGIVDDPAEVDLLKKMSGFSGSVETAIFVISLTEHQDQLSQWRGYCPPSGGIALGLTGAHLQGLASDKNYYLCPCIYDHDTQYKIVSELVLFYLTKFRTEVSKGSNVLSITEPTALQFARELSRFGVVLKHRSFKEEAEWRLVSPFIGLGDARIKHRPGAGRVVPYSEFPISTSSRPAPELWAIVGPTSDYPSAAYGVQSLMSGAFSAAKVWYGRSEAPYRAM